MTTDPLDQRGPGAASRLPRLRTRRPATRCSRCAASSPNCPACEPRSPRYRPHQAADCTHELCHGLYAATSDPGRVARWWARWPQTNIGARVPPVCWYWTSTPRHGGRVRLAELQRQHGPLPPTRVSVSGRGDGGRHCWTLHPGRAVSAVRLGAGLDLKSHTGYVLLPPSRHPATGPTELVFCGPGGSNGIPRGARSRLSTGNYRRVYRLAASRGRTAGP